uniref:hypothetical protein n=1 Tax=Daejeonella sp. TaxID=2805397 RepID=UPI00404B7018
MKIKYTALLILVLVFSSVRVKGQESGSTSAQNEKRAQNVFVELGGQGLLFTANYDSRFSKRMDGLGGRVGIGYISIGGDNATTVPLSLNYLLGTGRHFFEMGLGATLLATSGNDNSFLFDENNSNVIGTMSFSYRLQPVDQGFSFRA